MIFEKGRCFSFTWNNPGNEAFLFLRKLGKSEGISELIYQLEIGEKRHTPHLQGFIYFKNARHTSAVIRLLRGCHIQRAKNIFALKNYCKKVRSRAEPYFHFKKGIDLVPPEKTEGYLKGTNEKVLSLEDLYPWQAKVLEIFLEEPDNRTIFYFYEVEGNVGKSCFARFLLSLHPSNVFYTSGKPPDIKYGLSEFLNIGTKNRPTFSYYKCRLVVWDIPRHLGHSFCYATAEQIKNGLFYTTKYKSTMVRLCPPHVFVFSNYPPKSSSFSRDRWKIFQIRNLDLFPLPKTLTSYLRNIEGEGKGRGNQLCN